MEQGQSFPQEFAGTIDVHGPWWVRFRIGPVATHAIENIVCADVHQAPVKRPAGAGQRSNGGGIDRHGLLRVLLNLVSFVIARAVDRGVKISRFQKSSQSGFIGHVHVRMLQGRYLPGFVCPGADHGLAQLTPGTKHQQLHKSNIPPCNSVARTMRCHRVSCLYQSRVMVSSDFSSSPLSSR